MLSPETWRLGSLMKALRVVCHQLCDLREVLNVSEPVSSSQSAEGLSISGSVHKAQSVGSPQPLVMLMASTGISRSQRLSLRMVPARLGTRWSFGGFGDEEVRRVSRTLASFPAHIAPSFSHLLLFLLALLFLLPLVFVFAKCRNCLA